LQKKKRNAAVWCPTVRAFSFLSVIKYALISADLFRAKLIRRTMKVLGKDSTIFS
jgi:hypothetical protein